MMLDEWAKAWGVSDTAMADLRKRVGIASPLSGVVVSGEAGAQVEVRLEAARAGIHLWRNNVGALQDQQGRWVRYGLANDSKALNERVKSADLIGIRPVTIASHMIGWRIGQFVSREIKAPGWRYTGTQRETAQLEWLTLIASLGGDAAFATGSGSF